MGTSRTGKLAFKNIICLAEFVFDLKLQSSLPANKEVWGSCLGSQDGGMKIM